MPNYYDKHTASGASRVTKISLENPDVIDLEAAHKSDIGKVPVRINKTTIKLVEKWKLK